MEVNAIKYSLSSWVLAYHANKLNYWNGDNFNLLPTKRGLPSDIPDYNSEVTGLFTSRTTTSSDHVELHAHCSEAAKWEMVWTMMHFSIQDGETHFPSKSDGFTLRDEQGKYKI